MERTRREFLADVGRGMLLASLGPALATDLGLASARADEVPTRLTFGDLEPLVSLMQETPAAKLQPLLVERLKSGTDLRQLVAAGAMANARTFGGEDYVGFHTFMALSPAWEMSRELPSERAALPVLKVLYRNSDQIQKFGGVKKEVLRPVAPATLPEGKAASEVLRDHVHEMNVAAAEGTFAAMMRGGAEDAYNDLLAVVEEDIDVHRVVLAWRAWSMLDVVGKAQAHTFLRQSVHFCIDAERWHKQQKRPVTARTVLPKLIDQYKLDGKPLGTRKADDVFIEKLARSIYAGNREQGAEAVAAALADGIAPESVSDALAVAANRLLLCDGGRPDGTGYKGKSTVHGDSVGLHASDAANAWRNIARVSKPRHTVASLIVGGFHTAGQAGPYQLKDPLPFAEHLEKIQTKEADALLSQAEAAIRNKDQALAAAAVHRYGELGHPSRPVFDLLLKYACSEDGALHAEKYYRTVVEEFANLGPAFRWRELTALARVTASEFGVTAPGHAEACQLLKV